MTTPEERARGYLDELIARFGVEGVVERLRPQPGEAAKLPRFPFISERAVEKRWETLDAGDDVRETLLDEQTRGEMEAYQRNIENFVGTVRMPVGIAGPLRVNGVFARGDYFVPLATTEAALVASYSRGAQLLTAAGGCTAVLLNEGVTRAPGFAFESIAEAGLFVNWVVQNLESVREAAESTTRHGRLKDVRVTIEGDHVYLGFDFSTGDASGQNMATIATDAACRHILDSSPVKPRYHFVEANLSGDKKASALSFTTVRGKKVTAEARMSGDLVRESLHTSPEQMLDYWRMSAVGGVLSGTLGVQGHYANGLAALYIACGQDAACVAESAVGVTRMEATDDGGLYASVTLPNLMLGTVGGGTKLPTQRACLEILGCAGEGHARELAEIAAALSLAGELSIIGALAAGDFAKAHQSLARGKGE